VGRDLVVRTFTSAAELERALCEGVEEAGESSSGRLLALAVGSTTLPLYRRLDPDRLERVTPLPVDELVPEPADPSRSFSARLARALPAPLAARMRAIRPGSDPEACARSLEREIAAGSLAACVLGLGPDGHVAMNQPGSGRDTTVRVVDLAPENLARLGDVAPARRCLTLGVATLLAAERIFLVALGPGKAGALERVLEGPPGVDVPASWLRLHPACEVLVGPD
jgi:glucosamine-6-phosphate deaminase